MKHFLYHSHLQIHEVKYKQVDSTWSSQSFNYPHNRLYYITSGQAKIILKDRCLILRKGYMYLLPAFMMVETLCDTSFSHHFIHFHIDSLEFLTQLTYSMPILYIKCDDPTKTESLILELAHHYKSNSISSSMISQGTLQLLLAPFFINLLPEDKQIKRFKPVLEYIDNHIKEVMTLESLANILNLNQVYFTNLFTKTFCISPRQYIIMRRLNLAQLLLTTTNKKVGEIAFEVGFENEMYFSRLFKAKIGMTPGTYRLKIS